MNNKILSKFFEKILSKNIILIGAEIETEVLLSGLLRNQKVMFIIDDRKNLSVKNINKKDYNVYDFQFLMNYNVREDMVILVSSLDYKESILNNIYSRKFIREKVIFLDVGLYKYLKIIDDYKIDEYKKDDFIYQVMLNYDIGNKYKIYSKLFDIYLKQQKYLKAFDIFKTINQNSKNKSIQKDKLQLIEIIENEKYKNVELSRNLDKIIALITFDKNEFFSSNIFCEYITNHKQIINAPFEFDKLKYFYNEFFNKSYDKSKIVDEFVRNFIVENVYEFKESLIELLTNENYVSFKIFIQSIYFTYQKISKKIDFKEGVPTIFLKLFLDVKNLTTMEYLVKNFPFIKFIKIEKNPLKKIQKNINKTILGNISLKELYKSIETIIDTIDICLFNEHFLKNTKIVRIDDLENDFYKSMIEISKSLNICWDENLFLKYKHKTFNIERDKYILTNSDNERLSIILRNYLFVCSYDYSKHDLSLIEYFNILKKSFDFEKMLKKYFNISEITFLSKKLHSKLIEICLKNFDDKIKTISKFKIIGYIKKSKEKVFKSKVSLLTNKGIVWWITGLSGSGKTTVAKKLVNLVNEDFGQVVILDGDELRLMFGNDLGYDKESRRKSAERYSNLCLFLSEKGINVICSTISMFDSVRIKNRKTIENYIEIYIKSDVDDLSKEDVKGVYKNNLKNETKNLYGIDISYEEPKNPDLIFERKKFSAINIACDIKKYSIKKFLKI